MFEFSNQAATKKLQLATEVVGKNIAKEMATAINKAQGKVYSATAGDPGMSQNIRARLNIKGADLKKVLTKMAKASAADLQTGVSLERESRIPLKYFGARQTAAGVSYKIEKKGPSKTAPSAFGPKIPRLGQHVYKRETSKRAPIYKLYGVSVWGFFVKNKMEDPTQKSAKKRLVEQIEERARFLIHKFEEKMKNG